MRIAILSDIHDNLWNLTLALERVADSEVLICCGDLCSPFVMDQLAGFPGPVHIVFGNNDADLFRITRKSDQRVQVHGEMLELTLGGKRIAVNHFDNIARPLAESGRYDLVCYGHNHEFRITRVGTALAVNPGPIMGARFPKGKWVDVMPTFVIYDSDTDSVEAYSIHTGAQVKKVVPYLFDIESGWS